PLSYSVFQLYTGKNLDTVTQVEQKESFNWLSTDLERLTGAAYLAELVDAAIQENEKNQAPFLLILTCFHLFESIEPTLVIRCFEVKLLSILGYAPQLEDCVNCNRVTKGEKQYFSIELGGILCSECRYNDPECLTVRMGTLATMNYLMKADLRKLSRLKIPKPVAGELEQVVKRFLSAKLEKRFKSLDLLSKL
ncbi:MAG TPA: DNA repair protein RecO, partial [Desulfobacteria bacterium]|nr:DNA repair protein RecO [Desulfobacteria bacterium]